jgi:transcriptional regulator with AbiEi antitoxin domain of type IV toxin-antitoxin system
MSNMNRQFDKKLNKLLSEWPAGTVAVQPWLENRGIYRQLTNAYVKSGWLEKLERGAYIRKGDPVQWMGGLYAIQTQLGLSIHAGAKTALSMKGYAHYLALGKDQTVTLFGAQNEKLPAWFSKSPWNENLVYSSTNLFTDNKTLGLTKSKNDSFTITLSTPERAIMELIYQIPKHAHYEDAQLAMESLTTLRPKVIQSLLENCNSIKVKRFFMWLAEYNQHKWVERLDLNKIDFGKGKRTIAKGGYFDNKYLITIPKYFGRKGDSNHGRNLPKTS